jgi:hypothetical protein
MIAVLSWRPLPYDPARARIKGTEFAQAIVPGTLSRFAICETRALAADGSPDMLYRLRDAQTVSDADVARGIRPHVVGVYKDPQSAVSAALQMVGAA